MSIQKKKSKSVATNDLPEIPDKIYFTIGEVSKLCDLRPHVLRYWEQEFSQLRPSKRRGNRRYYQQNDVLLVRKIRELLYFQGFTIIGARQQLTSSRRANYSRKADPVKVVQTTSASQQATTVAASLAPPPQTNPTAKATTTTKVDPVTPITPVTPVAPARDTTEIHAVVSDLEQMLGELEEASSTS